MKTRWLIPACALVVAPFAPAAEVQTGASLADVKSTLGPPRGQVKVDDRQVLYYERGEVELQADAVTRVILRTPEEQAALDAREERQRAEREVRRNQLIAEGTALRDSKLADPAFKAAPLAYQVSFWETFAASYPGVSCLEPLTIARIRFNEQVAKERHHDEQAARIADLESRLAATTSSPTVYPLYTSANYGYGYGGYPRPYYPPSLGPIRYSFDSSSPAPYSTPHGSPYTTPSGSPYTTPSGSPYTTPPGSPYATPSGSMLNFPSYDPAQPFRFDSSDGRARRGNF